jgi:hypothetical protein
VNPAARLVTGCLPEGKAPWWVSEAAAYRPVNGSELPSPELCLKIYRFWLRNEGE